VNWYDQKDLIPTETSQGRSYSHQVIEWGESKVINALAGAQGVEVVCTSTATMDQVLAGPGVPRHQWRSLLVGDATVVVADMLSEFTPPPPQAPGPQVLTAGGQHLSPKPLVATHPSLISCPDTPPPFARAPSTLGGYCKLHALCCCRRF
jgi:hypothetical protein